MQSFFFLLDYYLNKYGQFDCALCTSAADEHFNRRIIKNIFLFLITKTSIEISKCCRLDVDNELTVSAYVPQTWFTYCVYDASKIVIIVFRWIFRLYKMWFFICRTAPRHYGLYISHIDFNLLLFSACCASYLSRFKWWLQVIICHLSDWCSRILIYAVNKSDLWRQIN